MKCEFCGRPHEHNPSDYYHNKECGRKHYTKLLKKETDPKEIQRLKRLIEVYSYVGD